MILRSFRFLPPLNAASPSLFFMGSTASLATCFSFKSTGSSSSVSKSPHVQRAIAERAILSNARKKMDRGESVPHWLRAKVESASGGGNGGKRGATSRRKNRPTFLRVEEIDGQNSEFGVKKEELPPPSEEQKQIIDFVKGTGRNVFITGGAGVGKSVTLRHVIESMSDMRETLRVAAPTGVAAMNISGLTLHSLFGLFPGDENDPEKLQRKLRMKAAVVAAAAESASPANNMRQLVIDEVSMVSPAMFEAARLFCQHMGPRRDLAWGGVQIIVCGDFLQLPPVNRINSSSGSSGSNSALFSDLLSQGDEKKQISSSDDPDNSKYCFQTAAWTDGMFQRFDLQQSFRQQNDADFLSFLNDARVGKVQKPYLFKRLSATTAAAPVPSSPSPAPQKPAAAADNGDLSSVIQIRATNKEVDAINIVRYETITRENQRVETEILASEGPDALSHLQPHQRPAFESTFVAHTTGKCERGLRDTSVVERLPLQRGARVVLLRNLDVKNGLVNGRLGTVVDFERLPPKLRAGVGNEEAPRKEGKKKKKKNGKNDAETTMSNRVARLPIEHVAPDGVLPIVDFDQVGPILVLPFVWSLAAGNEVIGTATQLPLRQAWSITSHRSQGLTLDRVEVDLKRFFDVGQGYVALSRSRTADGLKVLSAGSAFRAVRACPIALDFQLGEKK